MATFKWSGIVNNKLTEGDLTAATKEAAMAQLQGQGIIITGMTEEKSAQPVIAQRKKSSKKEIDLDKKRKIKKINGRELMIFTKKFASMVQAGLPILKTLKMLESQLENINFKYVVHHVTKDVEGGSTLSGAFSKFPDIFDTVYINLLSAGETSGKLTLFLQKLVAQIEKAEKIRSKVKGALTYPAILIVVAVGVIAVMLIKVVPVFQKMFSAVGGELPGPTRLIISISDFFRNPAEGGMMVIAIVGSFILLKSALKKSPLVRYKFDALVLKVPLIGDVIKKSTLAKISMIEGNLAAAGVPVIESLEIIAKSVKNEIFKEAFDSIKRGVSQGAPLSTLYAQHDIFPPTFYQMIAVGEETGNMDEMFEAITIFYEEEFDMTVSRMTELLEPIMIVFMGTTVGFIIIAMYMPIFQLGQMVN